MQGFLPLLGVLLLFSIVPLALWGIVTQVLILREFRRLGIRDFSESILEWGYTSSRQFVVFMLTRQIAQRPNASDYAVRLCDRFRGIYVALMAAVILLLCIFCFSWIADEAPLGRGRDSPRVTGQPR
jgi:hypothetical protein